MKICVIYFIGGCYDTAKRNVINERLNEFFNFYEKFLSSYCFELSPHIDNHPQQPVQVQPQKSSSSLGSYRTPKRTIVLPFEKNFSVSSPDPTTLFCTSGMQRLKPRFSEESYVNSFSNVQKCLRLNDLDEIGDSTHYLVFHMLGFFSFRQLNVPQTINFWLDFLREFGLYPHYVTIHPDKLEEWRHFYPSDMEVRPDTGCLWSDGNIGGYCTEFYYNDVEIGNIVNPLGTCIDVGFGIERLINLKYGTQIISKDEILIDTITTLIDEGFSPSPNKQGHVLRKLLQMLSHGELSIEHEFYQKTVKIQLQQYEKYQEMTSRSEHYRKKSRHWWQDSFGIDPENLGVYEKLKIKHPELK